MLIDLFINAKWHTVPLKGELVRDAEGTKSIPDFPKDWRNKYAKHFNDKRALLAGTITGKVSNIIAIDCDNAFTYELFKALDPEYDFHFISEGKAEGGGTIIYTYSDQVSNFKLANENVKLDFYADGGFVYLPTEANKTKKSWLGKTALPTIKEAPALVLSLLKTFADKSQEGKTEKQDRIVIANRLAPMIDMFLHTKEYDPILFKVLTPRSFRDLPSYVKKGHMHPNDVPEGRGSEYLSKISAILGADISVNKEMYVNTMMLINSMWGSPMKRDKLNSTIIDPMIEGRSSIDGNQIWDYDAHWQKMGFIATAINGDYLESFYDDVKGIYYLINYTVPYVKTYNDKRPVITTLKTLLGRPLTEVQYDSSKQLIRTTLKPQDEFGHVEGSDGFNLFRQSPELKVLNDPSAYKDQYVRPAHIINYFESLIPDDKMRMYVLRFIKTKLTTFRYSPVVLYLIGKHGSGKDTMVNILREIIGYEYIAKPETKVFLEQYNGWLVDKYFVQLDEYGNKLSKSFEKQEALGKLKAYTGSPDIQIRAMRNDGFNYRHSTTFIMTANTNPLPIETEDRRICFIQTPNKLATEDWVVQAGGISTVQEKIKKEVMDFCYYLGTEIKTLSPDAYNEPPYNQDKERLILESLPAVEQIVFYMTKGMFKELGELAEEYGIDNFKKNWEKGRLEDQQLSELYEVMTEGHGSHRTVVKQLKHAGFKRSHTTVRGENSFYYYISNLHKFIDVDKEAQFEPVEEKKEINLKLGDM